MIAMTVKMGNYSFEGAFSDPSSLRNNSGVYAVLTRATTDDKFTVVDVGESGGVRDRVSDHDREGCWNRNKKQAGLSYAAFYCDERTRMSVEDELRGAYNPSCGDR